MNQYLIATFLAASIASQELIIRSIVSIYPCIYILTVISTLFAIPSLSITNVLIFRQTAIVNLKLSCWIGFTGAIGSVTMMYSIVPDRTPLSSQLVLLSSTIITAIIISKIKDYQANSNLEEQFSKKALIFGALSFIVIGVSITAFLLQSHYEPMSILWIFLFLISVICTAFSNAMIQEYSAFEDRINVWFVSLIFKSLLIVIIFPLGFADNKGMIPLPSFTGSMLFITCCVLQTCSQVMTLEINKLHLNSTTYVIVALIMIHYYYFVLMYDNIKFLLLSISFPCVSAVIFGLILLHFGLES